MPISKNTLVIVTILILAPFNLSMTWPHRVGLLTDDFDIVTRADLDEEEEKATPVPLTKDSFAFQYWQCLPTGEVTLSCEDISDKLYEKLGEVGQPTFQLQVGQELLEFYTRHNYSVDDCEQMIADWRFVMDSEEVVCISSSFVDSRQDRLEDGASMNHSYWEIDRMKSRHGEWSWFDRRPQAERDAENKEYEDKNEVPNQYADDADFTGDKEPEAK